MKFPIINFQLPMNFKFKNFHLGNSKLKTHWRMATGDRRLNQQSGQALIMMLFFVLVGISITTAAALIIAANSMAATNLSEGIIAKEMADSGIESAMVGILRNGAAYTPEPINDLNGGTVIVTVSGTTTKTIISTATNGNFIKRVVVSVPYSDNILGTPTSWEEKYE